MAVTPQVGGPLTAADYQSQMQQLMPPGPAWTDDPGAAITQLLSGLSQELARIDSCAWQLIDEADPRTTNELLGGWERVAGLPDSCVVALVGDQTVAQRQLSLASRIAGVGGQSAAYFDAIAQAFGYTISITEFSIHTVRRTVATPIAGRDWAYAWLVNISPLVAVSYHSVVGPVNEALSYQDSISAIAAIECVIRRYAPAHTLVVFSYD